ncbi:MAG: DNA recombination/repair protein RecA, partial [Candidatus Flemingiibacterium sp.]
LREKIGVMYGNPETTPGGRALKFYASVRIEIRRAEQLKEGSEVYGNHVKCKVVKNKVAPPFKTAEFDIIYGKGIAKSGEIVDIGIQLGFITKSGSWFSYDGQRIAQGKENARKYIESNPDLLEELAEKIRAKKDEVESMMSKDYDSDPAEDPDESADDDLDIRMLSPDGQDSE